MCIDEHCKQIREGDDMKNVRMLYSRRSELLQRSGAATVETQACQLNVQ